MFADETRLLKQERKQLKERFDATRIDQCFQGADSFTGIDPRMAFASRA
ncbi:MAG: hypothetical protein ACLP4V_22045 [Methylocella sp.]